MPDLVLNRVCLVLDASTSMGFHLPSLTRAFNAQMSQCAQKTHPNIETTVSVWTFSGIVPRQPYRIPADKVIQNPVRDAAPTAVPSLNTFYIPDGNTALIDGTIAAIDGMLAMPPTHSMVRVVNMILVLTDGEENMSTHTPGELREKLASLPGNFTVGILVPNERGRNMAMLYGFPKGAIEKWDTSSKEGAQSAFEESVAPAYASHITHITRGGSGAREGLFSTGPERVNKEAVTAADLEVLDPRTHFLHTVVPDPDRPGVSKFHMREYVTKCLGRTFVLGKNFYELTKREEIQPQKDLLLYEVATGKVYGDGKEHTVRELLGIPSDISVRVSPNHNRHFKVLVRSDSTNRNMIVGQRMLIEY